MCEPINSSNLVPSSPSLSQMVGKPINLITLISCLTPLDTLQSLQELANKIKSHIPSSELTENIRHTVHNLIFRQFGDPITESIRELISNALDAHVRAKSESKPIYITLDKDRLVISDSGDGIGIDTVKNTFVHGCSSNAAAIFSLGKGIPNVTGRFGQGKFASYYYLLDHTLESTTPLPAFSWNEDRVSLQVPFCLNGKKYAALSQCSKEKNTVEVHCFENKEVREISIDTCRHGQLLKILFDEHLGDILVDIVPKGHSPASNSGTRFNLVSPSVETHADKIIKSIFENFAHVLSTPIFLNGKRINYVNIGGEALPPTPDFLPLKEISFPWGTLSFSSPSAKGQSTLIICEGGKRIAEYSHIGNLIAEKVVLNLKSLNLTHDRASINFQDPHFLQCIEQTLITIIDSNQLTLHQKSAILNAFSAIFRADRLNVSPVSLFLENKPYKYLPDLAGFETLQRENTLILNPKYLQTLKEPVFYQSGNSIYHWIQAKIPTPAVGCKIGPNHHTFIDSRLFFPDQETQTYFNLSLLNQWLENKGELRQLPLDLIFNKNPLRNNQPEQSNASTTGWTPSQPYLIDLSKYGINNQVELLPPNQISDVLFELSRYYLSFSSDQRIGDIFNFLSISTHYKQIHVRKSTLQYLFHVLCQYEELRFITNLKHFSESVSLAMQTVHDCDTIFSKIIAFLKAHPSEAEAYKQYILSGAISVYTFYTDVFDQRYWRWKKLLEASNYPEFLEELLANATIKDQRPLYYHCNIQDDHVILMSLVTSPKMKKRLLHLIPSMRDVPYLLNQPPTRLEEILTACHKMKKLGLLIFDESLYKTINAILENFDDVDDITDKLDCVVNCWKLFAIASDRFKPLNLNSESFLIYYKSILSESNENLSLESININLKISMYNIDNFFLCIKSCILATGLNLPGIPLKKENLSLFEPLLNNPSFIETFQDTPYNTKESCKTLLEYSLEWCQTQSLCLDSLTPENLVNFRETCLNLLQKSGTVLPEALPFVIALLNFGPSEFLSRDYRFPPPFAVPHPLHTDPDVLKFIPHAQLAASRIQSAMKQSHRPFSCLAEVIKNSIEAGARHIDIGAHLDAQSDMNIEILDDGAGMGAKEIKAYKTPGDTTKSKDENDPNFGWGSFMIYSEFNASHVSTSQDGLNHTDMLFEVTEGSLMLQQAQRKEQGRKGTKIILKKPVKNANQEFIRLKAYLLSTFKHLKNVTITFQGYPIGQPPPSVDQLKHTEQYIENGIPKGVIEFQANRLDEGIYWKNMRLGPINPNLLDLLPGPLKQGMNQQEKHYCIFLPAARQNMNRNQLINNKELTSCLQRGILMLSLKSYLKQSARDRKFKDISEDFWGDFRIDFNAASSHLKWFIDVYATGDWTKALDAETYQSENRILESAKAYFIAMANSSTKFTLENIKQASLSKHLSSINEKIKTLLSDHRNYAEILVHLKLDDTGVTLASVRQKFKEHLMQLEWLTPTGAFSNKLTALDPESADSIITQSIEYFCVNNELEDLFELVKQFKQPLLNHIQGIKSQQDDKQIQLTSHPYLARFINETAQEILHRKIEVVFYDDADNRKAFTYRGSNKIYINIRNRDIAFLTKWLDTLGQNSSSKIILDQSVIDRIVKLLEILCHELTHQEENKDCESTHDETFKKQMNAFLEKLFIRHPGQINCLQIFQAQ